MSCRSLNSKDQSVKDASISYCLLGGLIGCSLANGVVLGDVVDRDTEEAFHHEVYSSKNCHT